MKNHFPFWRVGREGQYIVVNMTMLEFFRGMRDAFRGFEFIKIQRDQTLGEQHLLRVEHLIHVIGGLLPGDKAGNQPGH